MVKATCCEEEFVNKLLDLVKDIWERGCTTCAWHDSALVAIPKKVTSPTVTTGGHLTIRCGGEGCSTDPEKSLQKLAEDAPEDLGGKVTNRDTNLWMRDRSQCANREVHRCIPEV